MSSPSCRWGAAALLTCSARLSFMGTFGYRRLTGCESALHAKAAFRAVTSRILVPGVELSPQPTAPSSGGVFCGNDHAAIYVLATPAARQGQVVFRGYTSSLVIKTSLATSDRAMAHTLLARTPASHDSKSSSMSGRSNHQLSQSPRLVSLSVGTNNSS